jgi:molecular chaperone GrpE
MTEARNAEEERLEQEAAAEGGEAASADSERDRPAAEAPADTLNAEANSPESQDGEADASAAGGDTAGQEEVPAADERDARIAELESRIEEYRQRLLRAQADFDNYRRRTQREKEETAKYASMDLITRLLPVLDNFERAVVASKDSGDFESLAKGVDMIYRQLFQLLEQEGLKPMETVGQPFNPEFHEAVMRVESDEHEEGTVVEELQRGYILKDRVIRPAMVKVSG